MNKILNIALSLSVGSHLLLLVFFKPSLGDIQNRSFKVFFLGSLLNQKEIVLPQKQRDITLPFLFNTLFFKHKWIKLEKETRYLSMEDITIFYPQIQRPLFDLNYTYQKIWFYPRNQSNLFLKDTSLMLYPYLPYSFLIYFKDRQKVNLEFLFFIPQKNNFISIKRKISSGNLEVDLLVMRYIVRSLYLMKESFPSGFWQTVKIELSRKDNNVYH